ncbi:MAG TPA: type II toxin-antitoxin system PemK/MazF family toxin [Longimicrobiaceae bacterium]|nr:type II toxin-antitoxin system PemK/MazF family toxin [Longimicrobiaceae bacterium]
MVRELSPVEGSEQAGLRPALVVLRDELNRTGMCMVVPGTTRLKNRPGRVTLPHGEGGVERETYLLCDQLRTVDSVRMRRRCGNVDARYLGQVLTIVRYFLTVP